MRGRIPIAFAIVAAFVSPPAADAQSGTLVAGGGASVDPVARDTGVMSP